MSNNESRVVEYGKVKVMVVDDQPFVRQMVKGYLAKFGIRQIAEAGDGTEGLKVLREFDPTLIICDINMKPMNGFDFIHCVRETRLTHIPTIMLTSHADANFVTVAQKLQVDGYLVKPLDGAKLYGVIDRILTEPRKVNGLDSLRRYLAKAQD